MTQAPRQIEGERRASTREVVLLDAHDTPIGVMGKHAAHTRGLYHAAISIVLGLVFIIGQVVQLIPGTVGEWIMKLMPGNAGPGIVVPVSFGPHMLDPWTGFAVFVAEVALLTLAGLALFQKRDA